MHELHSLVNKESRPCFQLNAGDFNKIDDRTQTASKHEWTNPILFNTVTDKSIIE